MQQIQASPIHPEIIDADPSVKHSFQADENFNLIYESSPIARGSYEVAQPAITAATQMAAAAGLRQVDRVIATAEDSRLMLFSADAPNASPPGMRILGLTTKHGVTITNVTDFLKPLL